MTAHVVVQLIVSFALYIGTVWGEWPASRFRLFPSVKELLYTFNRV